MGENFMILNIVLFYVIFKTRFTVAVTDSLLSISFKNLNDKIFMYNIP